MALVLATVSQAQSWDLGDAFSLASNPAAAWSYGSATSPGGFSIYTNNTNVGVHYQSQYGYAGLEGWSNPAFPSPLVVKNFSNVTRFQTFAPGDVLLHGYTPNQLSVVRWTNPMSGTAQFVLDASFRRVENLAQNPSVYWVVHNGVIQFTGTLLTLNETATFSQTYSLQTGDTLDFAVGFLGGSDATGLDVEANIQVVPEPATVLAIVGPLILVLRRRPRSQL